MSDGVGRVVTDRLVLRRIVPEDRLAIFQLDNDPEVMRFINGGLEVPMTFIDDNIMPLFLDDHGASPCFGFWAVLTRIEEEFCGWCCLRPHGALENPLEASVGYRFSKDSWGKGYATEASRALIELGFSEPRLKRIVATTYGENVTSIRVMEKLGFSFVRRFRVDLSDQQTALVDADDLWESDDVEYELLRD